MANVEVLRGPQGTLAGKSASGGAVFMNSRSPALGDYSGNFEAGLGDYSLFEFRGAVNMPVSDSVAFRGAFNYQNREHYYDEITGPYTGNPGEQDLVSFRLGMLIQPNDQLSVVAKVNVADLDFGGNVTSSYGDPLFSVPQEAPFAHKDETVRVVLDIDYTMNNGIRFSSLTGYQDLDTVNNLDTNGSLSPPNFFKSSGVIELFSQEFNLVSADDQRLRWVLGAFVQNQKAELLPMDQDGFTFYGNNFIPLDLPPWAGSPWLKDEDDWAVFGHIIYDLSDSFELEFGIRYSDYEMIQVTDWRTCFVPDPVLVFDLSSCFDNQLPADGTWFGTKSPGPDTQTLAEDSVDWRIGLNYDMNDNNFLYALVSRGHTTGSVNIFPPFGPYKEMEVLNFDAGWKSVLNDGRLQTAVSVYYETIDDWQAAFQELGVPLSSATALRNADSDSKIYGVEVTTNATFDNARIDFGFSWNYSELGTFGDVTDPLTGSTITLSGSKFPFTPEFSASIGAEYTFQFSGDMTITPRFDVSYTDDTQADVYPNPEFTMHARWLTNAQIRLESGDWYATIWATNLTNGRHVGAIQNLAQLYYAAPPRQVGIRVGKNF
jgi:iron complex outermembrane receptor protein